MSGLDKKNCEGSSSFIPANSRTYYVSFCISVQLQLLFDLPSPFQLSELEFPLPSSEEEWYTENAESWILQRSVGLSPPTPTFRVAFQHLFENTSDNHQRYSEFGGYIMISALVSAMLDGYRCSKIPAISMDYASIDNALDNWQRLWQQDPKSRSSGPSSAFGAMAFNASAVYRAASVRRFQDYSKYRPIKPN